MNNRRLRWSLSLARCLLHEAYKGTPMALLQAPSMLEHPLKLFRSGLLRFSVYLGHVDISCRSARRSGQSSGHVKLSLPQELACIVDNPPRAATAAAAA